MISLAIRVNSNFGQSGFQDVNINDIFNNIFGDEVFGDIFGDIFGGARTRRPPRGRNIQMTLDLDLKDAVFGKSIKITLPITLKKYLSTSHLGLILEIKFDCLEKEKLANMAEKMEIYI